MDWSDFLFSLLAVLFIGALVLVGGPYPPAPKIEAVRPQQAAAEQFARDWALKHGWRPPAESSKE